MSASRPVKRADGKIKSHATIEAQNAFLVSLYDSVVLESLKERIYVNAESFIERISAKASVHVSEILKIYAGQDVVMVSAQTHSGLRTHIKALARIIDVPIDLITHHVQHFCEGKKKGTITTTSSQPHGSHHTSGGTLSEEAGDSIFSQATTGEAKKMDFVAVNTLTFTDAPRTLTVEEQFTEKGRWGKKKESHSMMTSSSSIGVSFKADVIHATSLTDKITVTNPTFEAIETNLQALEGMVEILLGVNSYAHSCLKSSKSPFWNKVEQSNEMHTTYTQPTLSGQVNIHSKKTLVQLGAEQSNTFFTHIQQHGGVIEKAYLRAFHKSEYKAVQGPGQALMAVIAAAVMVATSGAGAALATTLEIAGNAVAIAMLDVAVNSVTTQMIAGTLSHQGDPMKGVKTLLDEEYLKGLSLSLATAGLTAKIGPQFKIKKPDASFIQTATNPDLLMAHLKYNLLHQGVNLGVRSTLGGESFHQVLKESAAYVTVDTISSFIANKIGQVRLQQLQTDNTVSNYVLHKIYHGVLGASRGAALAGLNGEPVDEGALGGAIGAVRYFFKAIKG